MSRRPGPAPSLNLLEQDVEQVAEAVKLRVIARTGTIAVYVRPDGSVVMEKVGEERAAQEMPAHWMVGTYDRKALVAEIEDDLSLRYRELTVIG